MSKADLVRGRAEKDLFSFAKLINPHYIYGDVHKDVFKFLQGPEADQLILLPRSHLKSHCIAVWCTWWIMKHPDTSIIYASGGEDLAQLQLGAIKNLLTSETFSYYWPGYVEEQEGKREEWNVYNIKIDHPKRKESGTRDRTVAARSIDGNMTGLHCDVLILDDIVVPKNAYTMEGRNKVRAGYAQLSSVANAGSITKVVGTRYHGDDIYGSMMSEIVESYDEDGNVVGSYKAYKVMQRVVETDGVFLWPRTRHPTTGRWEGYNQAELAKKRAKYFANGERAQFYSQYYNNPQGSDEDGLDVSNFAYFNRELLVVSDGDVTYKGKQLRVFCGADLAYTTGTSSDFSALAVVGVDQDGYIYILDLTQFKTSKYEKIYEEAERLYRKWHFRHMRFETNSGANLVAEYVKDSFRREGIPVKVDGKPARGEKVERTQIILHPRYENQTILHFTGGWMNTYEEQVILPRPSHDDLRDAVCIAIEISKPPTSKRHQTKTGSVVRLSDRFGGYR